MYIKTNKIVAKNKFKRDTPVLTEK